MIALRVRVPVACWRKGHARELLETEIVPPPSTCYGMLLSLVGETERDRHLGTRVTAGLFAKCELSTVLRTTWRIKDAKTMQGGGENAKPDFQQLVTGADLLVLCEGVSDQSSPTLEERVVTALDDPRSVTRFGGLSLGESTHLVNDLWQLDGPSLPSVARTFLLTAQGSLTLPVWVDHVGSSGTRYAVGDLEEIQHLPELERLPVISAGR